ncbi:MAG TPA: hypothetical protein VIJ14_08950, partial [Rhabdochlamydiaceae bacterium]
ASFLAGGFTGSLSALGAAWYVPSTILNFTLVPYLNWKEHQRPIGKTLMFSAKRAITRGLGLGGLMASTYAFFRLGGTALDNAKKLEKMAIENAIAQERLKSITTRIKDTYHPRPEVLSLLEEAPRKPKVPVENNLKAWATIDDVKSLGNNRR